MAVTDTTIEIHDMLAAGHLHQARDAACRLVAAIEQGLRRGEAVDPCYQSSDTRKCIHVAAALVRGDSDVWG